MSGILNSVQYTYLFHTLYGWDICHTLYNTFSISHIVQIGLISLPRALTSHPNIDRSLLPEFIVQSIVKLLNPVRIVLQNVLLNCRLGR